ncbi:mitochondrial carrier domain-containing protein [Lentinula lateritia]|nr:mitochondrial carrier domain-containing protein [Lentinula lateritia]
MSTSSVPSSPLSSSSTQSKGLLSSSIVSPEVASYFIEYSTPYILAGGCAGAASRTIVSPLERLKIIQQVQPRTSDAQPYKGVWRSLVRMWKEEGFRGYMRGNGINCLRIVPYRQFLTKHGSKELDTPKRLASGALAGITSVCTTYPLDIVRARLSIATASIPITKSQSPITNSTSNLKPSTRKTFHTSCNPYTSQELTMWGMTMKIVREEGGIRGLYRGLVATAFGVAPYVGINFAAYELLRGIITPPGQNSVTRKLTCGALAGSISQTLTYPFDVLRRKMQVTGMKSSALGVKYTGALDALIGIVRTEGIQGLYRGLWPNLLKVAPSIATSFFTYELVCYLLLLQKRELRFSQVKELLIST